jgi:predicted ArsR family transcriptional regulator
MQRVNPSTSHEAYLKLKSTDEVARHHAKIIEALELIGKGHYEKIAETTGLEKHKIGRRLSELERDGKIFKSGEKLPTSTNRNAYLYQLTPPESQLLNTPIEGNTVGQFAGNIIDLTQMDLFGNT